MSKVLVVFGATGQQGGSVIEYVLGDAELSKEYTIRAVTRDPTSEKSKKLKEKVEVVRGDLDDKATLESAVAGSHTVFIVTTPDLGPNGAGVEYKQATQLADIAVAASAKYLIFSTLPSVTEISGGKYTKSRHFDEKAEAEKYMRGLPIKSAFYSPGFFMQNYRNMPNFGPQKIDDSTWAIQRHHSVDLLLPMIDVVNDTGKFIGAILAEPEKYEGKTFYAATKLYDSREVVVALSKATGKNVIFQQISEEKMKAQIPYGADILVETFSYPGEFGYYGGDGEELVKWAASNARGRLNTLEEYFEIDPLHLE